MSKEDFTFTVDDAYIGPASRPHRWLGKPGESHYIPGWYEPHQALDREVTHNGVAQGMRIRDVLPFRRWALLPDGATRPQHEFEDDYRRYLEGQIHDSKQHVFLEYVPNVLQFVRQKPDPQGNPVDFAYNDDGAIVKTQKFTEHGDLAPEYLAKERARGEESGALRALMALMKAGKLSPEDFATQAEALYAEIRVESQTPEEIAADVAAQKKKAKDEANLERARANVARAREIKKAKDAERMAQEAAGSEVA